MMLCIVFFSLLSWLLVGAHPLQRRQGEVSQGQGITSESSDVQSLTAEVDPSGTSSSSQAADSPSPTVATPSPPPMEQQSGNTPSSTLTEHSTAGPVTATSTVHTRTASTSTSTSTLTLTSIQASTVTLFVTSTNYVTTIITTQEDTATSTRHTTVTTTVQSPKRRHGTWAMGKLQQAILPTPIPAANQPPLQRVAATTTELKIEIDMATATTTELIPSFTTITLVDIIDVPVTSFVYDGAKTTVTLNSTFTVTTTTLPGPAASTTAATSTIPSPSPEPAPIPPPVTPPKPGMPTKTKAAIGAGAAAFVSLLAIASIAYRCYRGKKAAKQDKSSSALAVQHYNNHARSGKAAGHRMSLEARDPTIPDLRPDPNYRGTKRTGVLTKRNAPGPGPVNMAEKAAMTEIAARSRLPMVGPRLPAPAQSHAGRHPNPSTHKGKGKAPPLWQGVTTPSHGKFREHIDEETDTVFGSGSRTAQPAHLRGLPVADHTGRFAPGSGEHGRFSAAAWKPEPRRQELEGDKKKQAWELPAEEVDGGETGREEVVNDMTSSVYSDAEEQVDRRDCSNEGDGSE